MTTCRNSLARCQDGLAEKEGTIDDMWTEQSKINREKYALRQEVRTLKAEIKAAEAKYDDLLAENKALKADLSNFGTDE